MKKITGFLMMAVFLIGFAACNNEDVPKVDNNEGNTYASMEIGYAPMQSPVAKSTRAVTETSFEGTAAEKNVASITLFGETTATTSMQFSSPFLKAANLWTVDAWATKAGTRSFGLGLNFATAPVVDLNTETNTTGAILGGAITDYVTTGAIAMSSTEVKTQKINEGVSQAQANSGTSIADNLVEFDVKRVVAKAAVRAGADSVIVTDGKGGKKLGSFSNLSFAPTNLSKETYLFEKADKDPVMLDASATEVGANAANYARLGDTDLVDLVKPTATGYHPYKAVAMNLTTDLLADIEGNYFFENIEDALFWGNITYMKVYGTFTPELTQIWDLNPLHAERLENPTAFATGTSFYKGAVDGKLYTTLEAAQFAVPGQQAYKYENGRMGYRVLVYQDPADADFDMNSNPVTNADVLRNYFYILDITAIEGLGFNYDGNDPNDPNLPKPTDNPDEPVDPEDGVDEDTPINSTDTYMRVEATVLPWTVVGRDVVLK